MILSLMAGVCRSPLSKWNDEVQLHGERRRRVVNWLGHPRFEDKVLVEGIKSAEAYRPVLLLLSLNGVGPQHQIPVEDFPGFVDPEKRSVVVMRLQSVAAVQTEPF